MLLRIIIIIGSFFFSTLASEQDCGLPNNITLLENTNSKISSLKSGDIQRNASLLDKLCIHLLSFREGKYTWRMLLVYNPKQPLGPFWFLPHNDEKTAFVQNLISAS